MYQDQGDGRLSAMLCTPWVWAVGQHSDNLTEENVFPVYRDYIFQLRKGNGLFFWTVLLTLGDAKAICSLGSWSWILCKHSSICSGKLFSKHHSSSSSLSSLFMHPCAVHICSSWLATFSSFPLPAFNVAEMLKALSQTQVLQSQATSADTEDDWCWL